MEDELSKSAYKKIGIAAGTLFTLMMVLFFVFVFYDSTTPKDHAVAQEPAEHAQVEEHATPEDHAVADEPAEHAPADDHGTDHSSDKE